MKQLVAAALLLTSIFTVAADERKISSFEEKTIATGQTLVIDGKSQSEPDIYYVPNGMGSYKAVRLSVTPPAAASDFTVPYLNMAGTNSIQVNWKTIDKPANAYVKYGLNKDNLDRTATIKTNELASNYHWNMSVLEGLQPDTPYYYQVFSDNNKSEVYRFRTEPAVADNKKIRVLLIGDHQRNERSDYEWMLNCARQTVAEKYGEGPIEDHINLILNCGDQVDAGQIELYEKVHLFKSRSVCHSLPIMTTVGNHETYWDDDLKKYAAHYPAYATLEYKGIKSGDSGYYAYQVGNVLFIVLNSDRTSVEQRFWLRKVVAAANLDRDIAFIVSTQHRPLYAEQYCNDVSEWMMKEAMPILSGSNKHVLNFSGHHHLYARGQVTGSACYHIISGGGVGTSVNGYEQLWGLTPDNTNHGEVQKTLDHWTYQIAEFDPIAKTMKVECYSIGNRRVALDNRLVDEFSIDLSDYTTLKTPNFKDAALEPTLPYTFLQQNPPKDLHSVNYQIATDPEFSNIVMDSVVTTEDYYGVDGNYMPVNLNENVDLSELKLTADLFPKGTYYMRARNRNANNLRWSAFSSGKIKFYSTSSAKPKATLTADHEFYRTGTPINIMVTDAPRSTNAWVGVYKTWKVPNIYKGGQESDYWKYTDEMSAGKWSFTAEPNAYYAVVFSNEDGYVEISDRIYFTVSPNCDDNTRPSISLDKKIYDFGEPVTVSFSNAPGVKNDWIGMYKYGVTPQGGIADCYVYVEDKKDGKVTLNVEGNRNFEEPSPEGVYFVSYFIANQFSEPVSRQTFVIGKPVLVDTSRDNYSLDDYVTVLYDGAPGFSDDKLVIYDSDTKVYTTRTITNMGGSILIGKMPIGNYEACMLTDNGKEVSVRKKFTVSEMGSVDSIEAAKFDISLNGRTINIDAVKAIGTVKIYTYAGALAYTNDFGKATSASFDLDFAPGIYILATDNGIRHKFMLR